MTGYLGATVSDLLVSLALVVGAPASASILVLLGATTLAAVTVVLLARAAAVAPITPHGPLTRAAGILEVAPLVPQRDPDAAGRVRPRAPGAVLG